MLKQMSPPAIAIVGMSCCYPDANSPEELWENVLSQRIAFRRIPQERLNLSDYYSSDRSHPDAIYSQYAAVIEGYQFDRVAFRVVGSTYRAADLTHWLALDMAAKALTDAGFPQGDNLPKEMTGVLLGNTLTGELSRSNTLRLRWPYTKRVINAQLKEQGMSSQERQILLSQLEIRFKAPFPDIGEESLAGNLSNTIAGRICNHFDLKGGGYTIDGACSSSLLAVAQASAALVIGDLDVAIAGGVDISIDPFELVGFAKAGALAEEEMLVYDLHSQGFIPGEGCGVVVLMRYEDALAQGKRIYSLIRGWGISSDGQGGITRPEIEGQKLALQRAYRRAGFSISTVGYFEGHGTGTAVGDTTELQALSHERPNSYPAVLGTIKANIGHTKAAAGIAGLIKTSMALYTQILPPTTSCLTPHPLLQTEKSSICTIKEGRLWSESPLRAGVSAMGFGGINAHLVLEGIAPVCRSVLIPKERHLFSSAQDAELIILSAINVNELELKVEQLLAISTKLSICQLGDLAVELASSLDLNLPVRAAIVASHPKELTRDLETLKNQLAQSDFNLVQPNVFLGISKKTPRICFLFPGQASPIYPQGGAWERRFDSIKDLYQQAELPSLQENNRAQPAIVTASLVGLALLQELGITAEILVGHSLGELVSLHWAGAQDLSQLIALTKVRGRVMSELVTPSGTMASIGANLEEVQKLLKGESVTIAGINSPSQTVISGSIDGIVKVIIKAQRQGLKAFQLPVSQAFHSPLVASAVAPFGDYLKQVSFGRLEKTVISSVTGSKLSRDTDLSSLLLQQITSPVRFIEAATEAAEGCDLFIEVGPGNILSRLVQSFLPTRTIALDAGGESLKGLLQATGMAFSLGVPIRHQVLFQNRFTRPFNLDWQPHFITNPCEERTVGENDEHRTELEISSLPPQPISSAEKSTALEMVRQLVAQRTELPLESIKDHYRLSSDLHLNSITVGQLVAQAAKNLELLPPVSPTEYADATLTEIAESLETLSHLRETNSLAEEIIPAGVDAWIRVFTVEVEETPLAKYHSRSGSSSGEWEIIAPSDYPLKQALQEALPQFQGSGIIACLSPNPNPSHLDILLTTAKKCLHNSSKFVLLQHGGGGAAFARTFYLENPQLNTCIVDVPLEPHSIEWLKAEIAVNQGYSEAYYDLNGVRRTHVLVNYPLPIGPINLGLTSDDVLLVTGGGKGIAAECALAIAKQTDVRLAILGRSEPESDAELRNNLARMQTLGLNILYLPADVRDSQAIKQAIELVETKLGTITAIIHGAGVNIPKLIKTLEKKDFLETLNPKVEGLRNLIAQVNPEKLKFLITFGSIIARMGLVGEADYALANEWLAREVQKFQFDYPACRCLNLEWSIWSGVGMGERLGRVDVLMQQGITPIPIDLGVSILQRLMVNPLPTSSMVISGRFGDSPTLKLALPDLPFLRFIEKTRLYYPKIELIVDLELSRETDLYLQDHIYEGEQIFPAVMGLEAMTQVAMALMETPEEVPVLEGVTFNRPVVVPQDNILKIRLAALRRECGRVDVVLRSEETAFGVDHFQATFSNKLEHEFIPSHLNLEEIEVFYPINPPEDLYGEILFHTGRFRRLQGYRYLRAKSCIAEITPTEKQSWFSRYLPSELILGDPGVRDATIHALQACIPHATILPTGIEKLLIYAVDSTGNRFVSARERQQIGNTFIYDLEVFDSEGMILEQWQGLRLQVIKPKSPASPWVASLLGTYLERCLQEMIPNLDITVIIARTPEKQTSNDQMLQSLTSSLITRRLDGKPELNNGQNLSMSHVRDLTFMVVGSEGCDVELMASRSIEVWQDLLGTTKLALAKVIAQENNESLDLAATRLWTAHECQKKAGTILNAPIVLLDSPIKGWVCLQSGDKMIATVSVSLREFTQPLVFAVLLNKTEKAAFLLHRR